MALQLRLAKDAVSLNRLPKARQQTLLRLPVPKLHEHEGVPF